MANSYKILQETSIYKLNSRLYKWYEYSFTRCPFCDGKFVHNDEVIVVQPLVNGHRRSPMFFHNDNKRKCYTLYRISEEIQNRSDLNYEYSEERVRKYGEENETRQTEETKENYK